LDCSFNNLSANCAFFANDWPKRDTVPNGLSSGNKSNLVIKWQNIWHLYGIPSGDMRLNIKSMDFDMKFNANFTNLTNFSWICNQKWNIFKWSRCLTKDTFMLKPTMWSPLALSFLFYHLLKIHIFAVYQFCCLFKLQLSLTPVNQLQLGWAAELGPTLPQLVFYSSC